MSACATEALLIVIWLEMIPVGFLLHAIPSIIAFRRDHSNRFVILVVNITLGGTGIRLARGPGLGARGGSHLHRRRRIARRRVGPEPFRR